MRQDWLLQIMVITWWTTEHLANHHRVTVPAHGASKQSRQVERLTSRVSPYGTISLELQDLMRKMFFAENSLLTVVVEVDNTEAHRPEGALSVCVTINPHQSVIQLSGDAIGLADGPLNTRCARCKLRTS